jgi:hypothetical protein
VLIARDNATRGALNAAARGHRRDGGHLGAELQFGTVGVAVGDRVICRRNDQAVDVDNGTRGTVRAVDPERVVLETDAGTVRALPAGYVAEHLEHAYALTRGPAPPPDSTSTAPTPNRPRTRPRTRPSAVLARRSIAPRR